MPLFCFDFYSEFSVLGLELRAFTLSHSTNPIFVKGIFKLFVQAGFKLPSSLSLPPK
jgi:hypothetical protein